jgi:hypothetical protein
MHRNATAKPMTDGATAIQRHRAELEVSTWNPNQPGSNQNHNVKKAAPTASEATVIAQRGASSLV